jgi:hypothetical protein
LATTSDDTTDNNEEVFGLDDLGDMFGNPHTVENEVEIDDDFLFDFGDDIVPNRPTPPEVNLDINTTNRDGETRHIREWVSRTITPQPVDYTVSTTLRDNNPDLDDVWYSE